MTSAIRDAFNTLGMQNDQSVLEEIHRIKRQHKRKITTLGWKMREFQSGGESP